MQYIEEPHQRKQQHQQEVWKHMAATCCDLVEGDGLSRPPTQSHAHPLKQLLFGEQELIPREDLGESQGCVGSWCDGHLTKRLSKEPRLAEPNPRHVLEHATFRTASVCSRSHPTSACPDSWKATTLCSSLERILLFFALPEETQTIRVMSATFTNRPRNRWWWWWWKRPTCNDSLHCVLKVQGVYVLVSLPGRVQRSFIANVGNVGTCRGGAGFIMQDALELVG